jgi:hypothetical protein
MIDNSSGLSEGALLKRFRIGRWEEVEAAFRSATPTRSRSCLTGAIDVQSAEGLSVSGPWAPRRGSPDQAASFQGISQEAESTLAGTLANLPADVFNR